MTRPKDSRTVKLIHWPVVGRQNNTWETHQRNIPHQRPLTPLLASIPSPWWCHIRRSQPSDEDWEPFPWAEWNQMDFKSCTRLKLHSAIGEKKHAREETMTFHYEIQHRIISTQGACIGVRAWQKRQKNNSIYIKVKCQQQLRFGILHLIRI